MKNLLVISLFLIVSNVYSQTINTDYSREFSTTYCGEEEMRFTLSNNMMTKYDPYYSSSEKTPAKILKTGFNNDGYFYELYSPKYYLQAYGIDAYNRMNKRAYVIVYTKKGGETLYVYEFEISLGQDSGKFFYTQKGKNTICN